MIRRTPGRIVIIGAGPTGLGLATRLEARGVRAYHVLERESAPGGLAASAVDLAGFTWDLGGHVQFSHYEAYDRALDHALGTGWVTHARTACIRIAGEDVPYPLQLHVDRLPEPHRSRALSAPDPAAPVAAADTFATWLRATFSATVCDVFLEPYNRKVWQHPLEDMGVRWVGERVARPQAPAGSRPGAWGPNAQFRYPAAGGTGAIWTAVAGTIPASRVTYGADVVAVDVAARHLRLGTGDVIPYDTLVTTMPLDTLVSRSSGLPDAARDAAAQLVATTVDLVGVGVALTPDAAMRARTWMYFPEAQAPYYRVTVLSNYARPNAPEGCYSLLAECGRPRTALRDPARLAVETLAALTRDGLLPAGAPIRSVWQRTLPHGYPVPTRTRDEALATLHALLEPRGIFSRGRFGGWRYEVSNQDHSYMQGVELADHLLDGTDEETYHHPDVVNSGYRPAAATSSRG